MSWCVYMIELGDGTYYTGITNNLYGRLDKHRRGVGSKYVKARLPIVAVLYVEYVTDRSVASKREHEIKRMRRNQKKKLFNSGIK